MDRRKIKTKKAITEAFNTLITKKRYEKISIQNIIDEADVGRSTFYEHFGTKDDLLRSRCHELFEHIFSQNDEKTTNHEFSNCPFDPLSKEFINANALKKIFTHILYHFLQEKKIIKGILYGESKDIFLGYLRKYLADVLNRIELSKTDLPRDFLTNHIAGSFIEATKWWADGNFLISPINLGEYLIQVIKI
ncbi:MAG: TetR/AcrR family transcriptional regulator [Clostridia bacterium]|nr:TetR/AcrR family transcriptional regulator [Clostridia bacterium]